MAAASKRPESGMLVVLAACVVVPLAFSIHAYTAKSIRPWGEALSLPFWFVGAVALGGGICLYLLLHPSRVWVLWARGCGLVGLVLLGVSVEVGQSAYGRAEDRRPSEALAVCGASMRLLGEALSTYAVESGRFPAADNWRSVVSRHSRVGNDLAALGACPAGAASSVGYAYNIALAGVMYSALDDPGHTVMLFETDVGKGWNGAGGPRLLSGIPPHFGGDNYAFADGHVEWIRRRKRPDGSWAKEPDADWVRWKP